MVVANNNGNVRVITDVSVYPDDESGAFATAAVNPDKMLVHS